MALLHIVKKQKTWRLSKIFIFLGGNFMNFLEMAREIVRTEGGDLKDALSKIAQPYISGHIIDCVKMRMHNIVWPSWSAEEYEFDRRFHGSHLIQNKEQGIHQYPPSFYPLCRINQRGELLDEKGMLDAYAWTEDEFKEFAESVQPFGGNSGRGILNMCTIIPTIKNEHDRLMFAHRMAREKRDLLLVTSAESARRCVEVTQELYDLGLVEWIDAWVDPDKNGNYPITRLEVGDRLIQAGNRFYCVRKPVYLQSYTDKTIA